MFARNRLAVVAGFVVLGLATAASAQESPDGAGHDPVGTREVLAPTGGTRVDLSANGLANIMLTGYWPPTNEMLREFSRDPNQNPGGWVGENWEGRGYNVYAFFPEFPGGTGSNPKGNGDFEVDYQDTSADWWRIIGEVRPFALITFSRANTTNGWELEGGNKTYASASWTSDYLTPFRPTADLPIMILEPPLTERYSTLPIAQIIADVQASGAAVNPFATVLDDGRFLSNFIGYHGCWYHVLHADPNDPDYNVAAGHIHVGTSTNINAAKLATQVTVRALLTHADTFLPAGDLTGDRRVDAADFTYWIAALAGPGVTSPPAETSARNFGRSDLDVDLDVDTNDYAFLQIAMTE